MWSRCALQWKPLMTHAQKETALLSDNLSMIYLNNSVPRKMQSASDANNWKLLASLHFKSFISFCCCPREHDIPNHIEVYHLARESRWQLVEQCLRSKQPNSAERYLRNSFWGLFLDNYSKSCVNFLPDFSAKRNIFLNIFPWKNS